jgi:DNA-binding CsgD family transcriptional regulator/PAS domain-containing protein
VNRSSRHAPDLSGLLDRLYSAAQEPALWPDFLELFADYTTDGMAAIHRYDLSRGAGEATISVRFDPEWGRKYQEHYASVNPWMTRDPRRLVPGTFNASNELMPEQDFLNSEWYQDFLRPQGYRYSLGAVAWREESEVVTLTTLRRAKAGPYGEREREVYRFVLPHLVRALGLEARLRTAEGNWLAARAAFDRLPFGVVQFGAGGALRAVNRAAEEIFACRDGLALVRGRLVAASPATTAALQAAIAAALAVSSGGLEAPADAVAVGRPSGRRPFTVLVCPLRPDSEAVAGERGAVLFLSDPERTPPAPTALLQRLYGLTAAESRVTSELVAGRDLEAVSEALGVTLGTARTHLKRVLAKTGTRRQAELVSVVLRSLAALGTP